MVNILFVCVVPFPPLFMLLVSKSKENQECACLPLPWQTWSWLHQPLPSLDFVALFEHFWSVKSFPSRRLNSRLHRNGIHRLISHLNTWEYTVFTIHLWKLEQGHIQFKAAFLFVLCALSINLINSSMWISYLREWHDSIISWHSLWMSCPLTTLVVFIFKGISHYEKA